MQRLLPDNLMIAAVSTRAEVTAQVDDVNLKSGKSKLFVQMKLIEKIDPRHLITLCCFRMSLEHMTEKMASVSGPFMK